MRRVGAPATTTPATTRPTTSIAVRRDSIIALSLCRRVGLRGLVLGAGYWVASAAQWLYQYLLSSQAADLATVAQSQILGYPAGCVRLVCRRLECRRLGGV